MGCGRVHIPSNKDIGFRLKLRCTPRDGSRSGLAKELVTVGAVEAGPGMCTFDDRHAYTVKEAEWPTMRVVSYNILADVYAQTELSKTVLYPYCAPYALQLDYRQSLVKKELAGYNADIICLQEVDKGNQKTKTMHIKIYIRINQIDMSYEKRIVTKEVRFHLFWELICWLCVSALFRGV